MILPIRKFNLIYKYIMIYLKELKISDVTKKYVDWMNDYEVHKYTEQKSILHTFDSICAFVNQIDKSKNEILFGIFLDKTDEHIGNIKLGPMDLNHKNSDISYFIGNKKMWGKGYTTLAIKEIIKIAKKMNLEKLQASFYEINNGSKKVLIKNGFKLEGKLKSQILYNNTRYGVLIYGLVLYRGIGLVEYEKSDYIKKKMRDWDLIVKH